MEKLTCKRCDATIMEGEFTGYIKKRCRECKSWNLFVKTNNGGINKFLIDKN